jgi:AraC-like DNA-binding protein
MSRDRQAPRETGGTSFPQPLRYAEQGPSAELADWVECYWSIRGHAAAPVANRVLPDGCSDVILGIEGMGAAVVGTMRTAVMYPMSGAVDLFGVRFRPGRAAPFLGVPLSELTDRRLGVGELWGGGSGELDDAFEPAAAGERVVRVERVLLSRLRTWSGRRRGSQELAERAIGLLRQARGGVGVREVAAALGVGERRLQRAFDQAVGMGPKALAGVLRFRRLVRMVERAGYGRRIAWAALAAEAGYADQAHLVRECKRLAGITPGAFAAERAGVGFVQEPECDRA